MRSGQVDLAMRSGQVDPLNAESVNAFTKDWIEGNWGELRTVLDGARKRQRMKGEPA